MSRSDHHVRSLPRWEPYSAIRLDCDECGAERQVVIVRCSVKGPGMNHARADGHQECRRCGHTFAGELVWRPFR